MKILVDETLGIPKQWLQSHDVLIRHMRLKKEVTLEQAIEAGKGSFISRKLAVAKRDIQSEMDEIHSYLGEFGAMFYFYDSNVANEGFLKRISNWNFPNRKLYLIDGSSNRAFTMFLIKELQERSFEEVYELSSHYDQQKFTITNDLKYQVSSHYLQLKEGEKKQYHLLRGTHHTKMTSGQKMDLIGQILEHLPMEDILITARNSLGFIGKELNFYQLEEKSLPISSEKIDIFVPLRMQ